MEKDDSTETLPPLDYFKNVSCPSIPVRPSTTTPLLLLRRLLLHQSGERVLSFIFRSTVYCTGDGGERRIADTHTHTEAQECYIRTE